MGRGEEQLVRSVHWFVHPHRIMLRCLLTMQWRISMLMSLCQVNIKQRWTQSYSHNAGWTHFIASASPLLFQVLYNATRAVSYNT